MKPMLSLDVMLGGGAGHALPGEGRSPTDDLEHRLVQIVWANREGLDAVAPTRGTALLQHGFKEWAAARGVTVVAPGQVLQAVRICDAENWMPLVLCRDLEAPLQVLAQLAAEGPCLPLALGAASSRRRAPGPCLWLATPDGWRETESQLRTLAPASLWCLLFLDDVALADTPPGPAHSLAPEVLAATLRWLQRQVPSVFVFMVSHERVTPAERGRIASLARHLGGALYRHVGVQREPFAPPQPAQKKR
jgi:hypothetical protein